MAPRHPPESSDDDEQIKHLQALHKSLKESTAIDKLPVPETEQDAPGLVKAEDVEVELDRMEAYLRGPTAFTA
ncbi:hypothetical protein [Microvirga terrestris]|uniref:DUF3072 domain-containing protein n=1 Tax=Microvirga terrestris TaxID=2791024 RepID=A0ABS0HMJ1_9HYPH|nr:hypothetical protein [Microvirga terrestris]MBF9194450.1 hypothetical protein [Microvirga terrestris]